MTNSDKMVSFLEELKAKNDIVSIVSRYMPLERKGRMFWGRCPFHRENTPSFVVNEYDQFYHCFGCGVGGDVIKFVQEIESLDFMGAVHFLADLAHMEVPSFSVSGSDDNIAKRKEEKDRLLSLMKDAARHYVENLKSPQAKVALDYFEKRNISPQIARMFGLGFSLGFSEIIDFLKSKGYTIKEMETAGVIKFKDNRPYDAVGGRIIFPIMDTSSNVVAFCGRTLDPKPNFAKYLNTAETVLFSKSRNLYAINLVKKNKMANGKIDPLIIVEGQMDVVSLHKAGFNSAVASMGTALTNEQAKLIKRFSDKVYICYDGDTAGKKATIRGLDILKETGLDVYVMSMPEGMDPDDVINKYGQAGYKKLIERALPLIDFKLEFIKKLYDLTSSEGKTKYINDAIEVLKKLSEVEREVYISKVSETSGILRDFIKRQLNGGNYENDDKSQGSIASALTENSNLTTIKRQKKEAENKVVQAEKFILSALLHKKPYAFFKEDMSKYFTDHRVEMYQTIINLVNTISCEKDIPKLFYEKYQAFDNIESVENLNDSNVENKKLFSELASEIINYVLKNNSEENDLGYYKDCVLLIYKNYAEKEIERLTESLRGVTDREVRNNILEKIKLLMTNIKDKKVDF